jgi:hypothetical protein
MGIISILDNEGGLYLSKMIIVDKVDGELTVLNENNGSSFQLKLNL